MSHLFRTCESDQTALVYKQVQSNLKNDLRTKRICGIVSVVMAGGRVHTSTDKQILITEVRLPHNVALITESGVALWVNC